MSNAPHYEIDVPKFWADPYPDFARMRQEAPIELGDHRARIGRISSAGAEISRR